MKPFLMLDFMAFKIFLIRSVPKLNQTAQSDTCYYSLHCLRKAKCCRALCRLPDLTASLGIKSCDDHMDDIRNEDDRNGKIGDEAVCFRDQG